MLKEKLELFFNQWAKALIQDLQVGISSQRGWDDAGYSALKPETIKSKQREGVSALLIPRRLQALDNLRKHGFISHADENGLAIFISGAQHPPSSRIGKGGDGGGTYAEVVEYQLAKYGKRGLFFPQTEEQVRKMPAYPRWIKRGEQMLKAELLKSLRVTLGREHG